MKYLSHYVEDEQTELFDRLGVFFAFSQKQLDEARVEGVTYVSLGAGIICPEDSAKELVESIESIGKKGRAADLQENGEKGIIWREFSNHEAQIVGDISDTVDALEGYEIPLETIEKEFRGYMNHCVENDLF